MMAQVLDEPLSLAPGPSARHDIDANEESHPLLCDWLRRFGPTYRVPSLTRRNDGLVIHDPEDVRHVLLANRANYVKGAGMDRVRMLLGNGLIVSDGDHWSRQRRLMQPAFHGQKIRAFSGLMQRANAELIGRWTKAAAHGAPIDLTRDLSEVALAIVLGALFGADLDRLVAAEGENPFDLLTRESRRDLPFAARFRALTRVVRQMIDARRRERRIEPDFLSMLMEARDAGVEGGGAMAERAIVDEVMTLIVAGHETTASTLNWTWYLLSQHAGVEARLHASVAPGEVAEVAGGAGERSTEREAADPAVPGRAALEPALARPAPGQPLDRAGYAEQVLQEALRLYPPVWLFSRRALADDRLGGFRVAAGTDIFICPYLLHRDAAQWQRPEAFEPERFAAAATAGRHRFAYLPFSAGPRLCIGAGFAMAEMATHLVMVAQRFRLEHAGTAPPQPEFQINLRTRDAVRMRLVAR